MQPATASHDHNEDVTITDNNSFLMAMGAGSRIEIHAADAHKESWSQLDVTAQAGDQTITVDEDTGWEVGDRIAIAASGYDHDRAEEFTITGVELVDGKSVLTLDGTIRNYHHGEMQSFNNGLTGEAYQEWDLDERAEVALLTRNVTIQGDADSDADQYGGHTMVMHDADMHISGAAFQNMGQAGELGRYPIHAHMMGDSAEGTYVSNVSVVNSFNKGIAIHDSNNMWLEDNVVYDTIGHGFFFEDGSETGNVLKGNLAFDQNAAKADNATIPTDASHTSSYWITNPNNHFLDNHAAGSHHTGFFFTYEDKVNGKAGQTGTYDDYTPAGEAFGLFKGNAAHSNKHNLWHAGDTGDDGKFDNNAFTRAINEDGNLYAPSIEDFTSYRAWGQAIFNKDVGGFYDDIKSAGNNADYFVNQSSIVENSLSVGQSANPGDIQWAAEIAAGTELPPGIGFNGYSWYDGGQLIRDSHFEGFTGEYDTAFSVKFGQAMGGGNVLDGITFGEDTTGANRYSHASHWDSTEGDSSSKIATQVVDLDGSLTGTPGATLTTALPQLGEESFGFQAAPGAIYSEDWNVWINGPEHDIGHFKLWNEADNPFDLERSDGLKVTINDNTSSSEVLVVANTDLSYIIRDSQNLDRDVLHMRFGDLQEGSSFYLAFEDVAEAAVLRGATEVADKAEADAFEGTAYYREDNTIHVKVFADSRYIEQIHDKEAAGPETVNWEDEFRIDVTGNGGLVPRGNVINNWGAQKWKVEPVVADVDQDPDQPMSTSKTVELDGSEKRWSDPETWDDQVPGPDDIVVIQAGERVLLDQNVTVKGIVVKGGELIVEDVTDLALASDWVLVIEGGLFQVGTEANPHVHDFTLTLEGDDPDADFSLAAVMADPETLFATTAAAEVTAPVEHVHHEEATDTPAEPEAPTPVLPTAEAPAPVEHVDHEEATDIPAEPVKDDTPETAPQTEPSEPEAPTPVLPTAEAPAPVEHVDHEKVTDAPAEPVVDDTPETAPEMDPHTVHEPEAPTPAPPVAEEPVVPTEPVAEPPVELDIAEVLDLVSMPSTTPDTPAEPVTDDAPEATPSDPTPQTLPAEPEITVPTSPIVDVLTPVEPVVEPRDIPLADDTANEDEDEEQPMLKSLFSFIANIFGSIFGGGRDDDTPALKIPPAPKDNAMHDAISDDTPETAPETDPHTVHEPEAPTPAPPAAEEPVVPAELVAEPPVELDIAEVLDLVSMPSTTPDTPAEPVKPVVEPRDIPLADDTANEDEEEEQPMFKSLFSFSTKIFGAVFGGGRNDDTPALKIPPAPKDAVLLSDLLPVTGSMEDDEPALEDMDVEDEGKELFA